MTSRGKFFELLDFPKFAKPNVVQIAAAPTALEVAARLGEGGFMSYGQLWPRMGDAVRGIVTDHLLKLIFSAYQDEWKNENIRDAFSLLQTHFSARGNWYPQPSKPKYVLGFWFKPSIKGIWFVDGQAYAVAVNARKGQALSMEDVNFLARGIYELHCIDDPNDPIPLVLDLSAHPGEKRKLRPYPVRVEEAVSLEAFESSVREFLAALNLVGLSLPPPPDIDSVVDLFRR
jgi:hypothetical protein